MMPSCPPGYVYDPQRFGCVAAPGYTPGCPPGHVYDPQQYGCVQAPGYVPSCPSGMIYDGRSGCIFPGQQPTYRPPQPEDFVPEAICPPPTPTPVPLPPIPSQVTTPGVPVSGQPFPLPPSPDAPKMRWVDPRYDFWWGTFGYEFGPSGVIALLYDRYGNWYFTIGLGAGVSALGLVDLPFDIGGGMGGVVPRGGVHAPPLGEDALERAIIGHTWTVDLFPLPGVEINFEPPLRSMQLKGEDFVESFLLPELWGVGISAPSVSLSNTMTVMIYDANTPNPWQSPWQGKNKGALVSYLAPWWLQNAFR
jgi:hypothetical protein